MYLWTTKQILTGCMLHDIFPISCNLNSQPLWCNICYPRCPNLVGMMSMLKVAANRYKQASIRAALLSNFSTNKRKAFRKLPSKKKNPSFFSVASGPIRNREASKRDFSEGQLDKRAEPLSQSFRIFQAFLTLWVLMGTALFGMWPSNRNLPHTPIENDWWNLWNWNPKS